MGERHASFRRAVHVWEKEEVCMHSCDGKGLETLRPSSGKRPDGMNTIVMYFKTDPEEVGTDFHLLVRARATSLPTYQRLSSPRQLQTVNASTARSLS